MKLTDFQTKFVWGIGILIILLIWMIFPLIFKQLISVYDLPENLKEFGAFGDIYGSLNTLISSIALCAVAFSTWLQVTSLNETRDANERQLKLAKEAHDAQINESKHAIFSNMFNSLLVLKNNSKEALNIEINGSHKGHDYIFYNMKEKFLQRLSLEEFEYFLELNRQDNLTAFLNAFDELEGTNITGTSIVGYFQIYSSILDLIKHSNLSRQEKFFYYDLVGNTMSLNEQICLMWAGIGLQAVGERIKGTELFWINLQDHIEYIEKFYNRSCFCNDLFLDAWNIYDAKKKEETSA